MEEPNNLGDSELLAIDQPLTLEQQIGRLYEAYVALMFRHLGWRVETTATTGDFGGDLLIYWEDSKEPDIVVQCKHWSSPVDIKAVQEVYTAQAYYKAKVPILITTQPLTAGAKKLADATGVGYHVVNRNSWRTDLPLKPIRPELTPKEPEPSPKAKTTCDPPKPTISTQSWAIALILLGFTILIIWGVTQSH